MGECLIIGQTGERKTPVLNANYPADAEIWCKNADDANDGKVAFQVVIQKQGSPKNYTYQWYRNGTAVEGATGATWALTDVTEVGTHSVYCEVTNKAGTVKSRTATLTVKSNVMMFTYGNSQGESQEYEKIDDENGNWRLKLKSSGLLTITEFGKNWDGCLDIFVVGGGGSGATGTGAYAAYPNDAGGGGGGGGYTLTEHAVYIVRGKTYKVTIGNGGAAAAQTGGNGGSTSFDNLAKASGGNGGTKSGGDGGNGGGGSAYVAYPLPSDGTRQGYGGNGGSDGSNGTAGHDGGWGSDGAGGTGQGTTTREFGESTGDLYSGGGAGCGYNRNDSSGNGGDGGGGDGAHNNWYGTGSQPNAGATDGEDNTGGGGGGSLWSSRHTGSGGSGIAVIRNTRSNPIPITQQPQDVTAAESANAVFTVTATGTGLTYQWQFLPTDNNPQWSDTSATGAKTHQLTVQALSYRNNYQYRCVITNGDGVKTTSLPATLTVQS